MSNRKLERTKSWLRGEMCKRMTLLAEERYNERLELRRRALIYRGILVPSDCIDFDLHDVND